MHPTNITSNMDQEDAAGALAGAAGALVGVAGALAGVLTGA